MPLSPQPLRPMDKWVVMVPEGSSDQVSEAMFAAGAGAIGEYRDCSWSVVGVGQFEPQAAANPAIGTIGKRERVDEARVEMVAERGLRRKVLAALRAAHLYEEPAFDILELAGTDSDLGLGRVGHLPHPMTAGEFVALAQRKLNGPWGVRATGDPATMITTVAVCGGAGDSLLGCGQGGRCRPVPDGRPAPPPGRRGHARRRARPCRRGALGHRVPMVRVRGGTAARARRNCG